MSAPSVPSPISWHPSGQWIGNDGNWSSFNLRAGTPAHTFEVLISSADSATWLVGPTGCEPSKYTAENCPLVRGGIFNSSQSSSWHDEGSFGLFLEDNLGKSLQGSGNFGLDTVSLGASNVTGGPVLDSQVLATVTKNSFYSGHFGLNNQPTNFTDLTDTHPSFLTGLKSRNLIPSASWSYTAGAWYRDTFGSVTFGGYDASRFEQNNVSFTLAPDISRDLVVSVRSISSVATNGSTIKLLSEPILAFIDSTISPLYLPLDVCSVFEETFGLTYSEDFNIYLISDEAHQQMMAKNPNITLTLGEQNSGGPTVDIVLPYSSFNLKAIFPKVADENWYFPLQPAMNESQYTLGRTLLQEAYLITNYEHGNFSVSQARFDKITEPTIVAIPAASSTAYPPTEPSMAAPPPASTSSGLSQTATIGIAVGVSMGFVLSLLGFGLFLWRRRQRTRKARGASPGVDRSQIQYVFEKQELDGRAFIKPRSLFLGEKKEDLSNIGTLELPDEPLVEIMTQPKRRWGARRSGSKMSRARSYTAYINVQKAKENRMSNGKISPPISKFCSLTCTPFTNRFMHLNRTLPPTPIATPVAKSPRHSVSVSPLPRSRQMSRPMRNFSDTLVVPKEIV